MAAMLQLELGQLEAAEANAERGLLAAQPGPLRRQLGTALGHIRLQRDQPRAAAEAFAQAAAEGPSDPELQLAWAQALQRSGQLAQALEVLENSADLPLYGHRLHAQVLLGLGRPEEAQQVLERLLDNPAQLESPGELAMELAELHAQAGDPQGQLAALERAVSLAPRHVPALRALVERQIGAGLLTEATASQRRLIELENTPETHLRLVDILLAAGQSDAALSELRQLMETLPDDHPQRPQVLRQRANVAEANEDWSEAAQAWAALYRSGADQPSTLILNASRAARRADKPEIATELLASVNMDELTPDARAALHEERAQVAAMSGDLQQAVAAQEEAVEVLPTAGRHYRLAQYWRELNQPDRARAALERAVMLAPDNPEYQATLGYAYLAEGDDSNAVEHFEAAVAVDPQRLTLYEELGYAYRRMGRNAEAARAFRQFIERQDTGGINNRGSRAPEAGSTSPKVRVAWAQALQDSGQLTQALAVLEAPGKLPLEGHRLHVKLLLELGRPAEAERVLERLLEDPAQLESPEAVALELAELRAQAGDPEGQLAALEGALAFAPQDTAMLRQLVERQVGAGALTAAAATQRRLIDVADSPEARMRLVDVLLAAGEREGALAELRQLVQRLPEDHPQRPKVLQQWANVTETQEHWLEAAQAWEALYRALDPAKHALDPAKEGQSPLLLLNASRAAQRAGQPERASRLLAELDANELEPDIRALLYEDRAQLAAQEGELQQAVASQRAAVALLPTAERHYRLAQYLREQDEFNLAQRELQQAVALAPDNPEYQASLGYAYLARGDDVQAKKHFEAALAADPQHSSWYGELGYVYRRLGQDEAAAGAFRELIDRGDAQAGNSPGTGTDESGYQLRREVQQLEDRFRINAGLFMRNMRGDGDSDVNAPLGGTGLQSLAGVDLGYRLDNVSDGRFAEVFARSFWEFEEDSLSPIADRTQGGVGLRVKPFAPVNLFLSGERLIALGDEARDDWLVRISASFNRGTAYEPQSAYWGYRSIYLDAAMQLEESARFLVAEWRQGVAFRLGQGLSLVPYAVAAASYTDDAETERRIEVGPGVALLAWGGGDAYRTHSAEIELGLEYREVVGGNTDEDSGIVVRLQLGL